MFKNLFKKKPPAPHKYKIVTEDVEFDVEVIYAHFFSNGHLFTKTFKSENYCDNRYVANLCIGRLHYFGENKFNKSEYSNEDYYMVSPRKIAAEEFSNYLHGRKYYISDDKKIILPAEKLDKVELSYQTVKEVYKQSRLEPI